jgi:Fe-S-cluster containining protein
VADYEVDYSDIAGRKVECPEGCGMCCLCQPEVLPEERAFFRENYPERMIKMRGPDAHFALAMKKGCGSCVFLSDGKRKCQVYDHRTAYCRQYPFHLYLSDRVKVELDMSCRGVWTGNGTDAMAEAKDIVAKADRRIVSTLRESRAVYGQFYANCKEAGILSDQSILRMSVSENLSNFADLGYLSKVMELSQMEPVMSLSGVQKEVRPDMPELEIAARESALDSMATNDPLNAPVYCDPEWNWNVFMAKDENIVWNILTDSGDLVQKGSAEASEIPLKPLEEDGAKVLADYIRILNGRDSFMGSVFSLIDYNDYEDDMANAYYGCLSVTVLDLMWRASMLDHFTKCGMGAKGIQEAVIFYDMDRLDAPAIGAFV